MAKILLAEDEEVLRMLVVDTLEDEGHTIEEAKDGEEALNFILNNEYDLIILDYMMPVYTGLDIIMKVRELPEKEAVKIMMLSAKSQVTDQQAVLRAGANYFMAKPFSPKELVIRIEEILGEIE
ncbi:response regulator transcription factor [Litchfieldia alkalitelluris]|uniref:response regulator transcription factor n=1 Tax=Litchfieldia alkalitelluris TaxID=304268 RepID=UPI00099774FA|nr:response regulator [Litchfieldia alkalitelluris]